WGGGVCLAELSLAQLGGARVAMISSNEYRLQQIAAFGMTPIDRRKFSALSFDEARYEDDHAYRICYQEAERAFLDTVAEETEGAGVSIFIDNIGNPVFRATLKALARQGVVTTAGWKEGMELSVIRAMECIRRHIHVHTHYARYDEGLEAVSFACEHGWMAPEAEQTYNWEAIPLLARDYAEERVSTYFPIFEVNRP
ncbi:MAG TPA: zinc-binding alcohol dehydrogenase family protein, partial [Chloroflexota bacterium]|nr:zinc-binding alcohol dehydrogenase family protein [Chloroflexota bacterium]